MRLTRKDVYATFTMLVVVGVYAAYLIGTSAWPLESVRWTAGLVLLLGGIGCGFGSAADLYLADRNPAQTALVWAATALGVVALVAAAIAVIAGTEVWLAVLVGATVALWLISTVRHAFWPTAAERMTEGRMAQPPRPREAVHH